MNVRAAPLFPPGTDPKESTMTHLTCDCGGWHWWYDADGDDEVPEPERGDES